MTREEILDAMVSKEEASVEIHKLRRKLNLDIQAIQAACDDQISGLRKQFEIDTQTYDAKKVEAVNKLQGL